MRGQPGSSRGVIVHEWIEPTGGSEKVVDAITHILPGTDIVCLWDNDAGRFAGHRVSESVIARTRLRGRKALSTPVVPAVWRYRENQGYEWAVVSSHQFAHHVRFRGQDPDFRKFVYVHTPARYLWTPELDPRGQNLAVRAVAPVLRAVDRRRAAEAESIAVNSRAVQERVATSWERESVVLYPPVDVDRIQACPDWSARLDPGDAAVLGRLPGEFLLGASRLVTYKRLDDVIRLGALMHLPVVIAGDGPERGRLESQAAHAGVRAVFVGRVSDELLYALYQRAIAYVFPAIEDFGIMPVEAMAAGARVVASHLGGTAETVADGVSGALCDFGSAAECVSAVGRLSGLTGQDARQRARLFSAERFATRFREWIEPLAAVPAVLPLAVSSPPRDWATSHERAAAW